MISKVIPVYARDFKREFVFIKVINKKCERFVNKINEKNVFNSSLAKKLILNFNKFLIFQNLGYFKDINDFYLENEDVIFIEYLESKLDENMDLLFNPYSFKFDQEKYENDDTGFKEFFESFRKFKDKIKIKEMTFSLFSDSDSDSDSD